MTPRVAFDTETWKISAGLLAPPLVCGTFYEPDEGTAILLRDDTLTMLEALLDNPTQPHIVGQNIAFDFGVVCHARPRLLPKVFAAYEAGRIRDIGIRDKLIAIARGILKTDDDGAKMKFDMASMYLRRLGKDISEDKKNPDAWRLRYHELDGVPLDQWPEKAKQYPLDDATRTMEIFDHQTEECGGIEYLPNEQRQTRRAWTLHLMRMYGVRTDLAAVVTLESRLRATTEDAHDVLLLAAEPAYREMQRLLDVVPRNVAPDARTKDERLHFLLVDALDGVEPNWTPPADPLAAGPLMKQKKTTKRETGLIEVEESRSIKALQACVSADFAARGLQPPRTPPSKTHPQGQVQYGGEVFEQTTEPRLLLMAATGNDEKIKSVWLEHLTKGIHVPINPTWNNPVATGRTSCFNPPMQQLMRKGGVRECFVPRPGFLYLSTDYSFIELCAWAQICLDMGLGSTMADVIRAGKDPHVLMGTEILRAGETRLYEYTDKAGVVHGRWTQDLDYDFVDAARRAGAKWAKDARQLAKAANFGLPGGLGSKTFILYAWGNYGVRLTFEKSETVKEAWKRTYPEAVPYFNKVKAMGSYGEEFQITQARSLRVRGGCTFTSAANGFFQGLTADGTEEASWSIAKECYLDAASPLYGCRPVVFNHDEFILEVPDDIDAAHAANVRLMKLMLDGMQVFIPDVPVKAEPTLMRRWYKDAEPVYDEQGRLRVWEPKTK